MIKEIGSEFYQEKLTNKNNYINQIKKCFFKKIEEDNK
jgi:hypothetical protein